MVRIGILACDAVREPLLGRHGDYPEMFERLLGPLLPGATFVSYRVFDGIHPEALAACDAYIISGSRSSVYDDEPWIRQLMDWVREAFAANRRVVGICFGHQLLAHALGGRTERARQGWGIGRHATEVVACPDWMHPAREAFSLYYSHQDQVTVLPPGARLIARNTHCPHAMFDIDGCCLGIQGHPEFSAEFARDLVTSKIVPLPAPVLEAALPTYGQAVDAGLVAQWMADFLRRGAR